LKDVVFNQVHGVETLQWVITLSTLQKWMVGIVTVTTTKVFQLVLLSLEPWALPIQLESVGFVAVAGLFHMDTVVRVVSLTSVEVAAVDKVELAVVESSKSLTFDIRKSLFDLREFKTPFFCVFL
jgi:hypothetical protein